MKKIMLATLATGLITSYSFSQKLNADKVPAVVKTKFAALYPKVTKVAWELEKSNYEAGFDLDKVETSVLIDPKGNLKETESEIAVSSLPKGATDYLAKTYPGVKIAEAAKIVDANGTVKYEAEVKGKDLMFDSKGNFVK